MAMAESRETASTSTTSNTCTTCARDGGRREDKGKDALDYLVDVGIDKKVKPYTEYRIQKEGEVESRWYAIAGGRFDLEGERGDEGKF